MNIFRYWQALHEQVSHQGNKLDVTVYGGSNLSPEDALRKAKEKVELVAKKIRGEKISFETYDAEIREEILEELDPSAIVTRNRYGAEVLNVERLMIIDIDHPKPTLAGIFRGPSGSDKDRIVKMVADYSGKAQSLGVSFRIYETQKGIRVIVAGRDFPARDPEAIRIMKELHCDPLYLFLCRKQNCYRARLTPKPSRMKLKAIRIIYPKEEDIAAKKTWIASYNQRREEFSVCKFISQVGANSAGNPVIQYHDQKTGAFEQKPLA